MVVPNGIHAIPVLEEGAAPGYGAWIAVILVSISSLAGAWLARRNSTRVVVWLAIASATMLVIAMTDLLPDAWREAGETGVPLWAIGIAAATGFLVITYFTRKGCGCEADSGKGAARRHAPGRHRRFKEAVDTALFGGMGTAAALTLHRAIEGATLALTASVVVVLALMVHSASEGLALAALLDMAKQRLAPWLLVACAAPAVGVLAATIHPLPGRVVPILLGMISGVLTRTAVVGLKLAASKQSNGRLSRRHVTIATISAVTVGALIVVAHAGQGQQTAQKRTQRADGFRHGSSRPRRPMRAGPLGLEKQTRPMISPQPLSRTQHESPPVKAAPAPQSETETLTALRSDRTSLAAVLQRDDDTANSLRVAQVLRALPRYRPDQITTVMATVGISEEHRLGDLSESRRHQLLTAIGTVRPASTSSFFPQTPTHVGNRTPQTAVDQAGTSTTRLVRGPGASAHRDPAPLIDKPVRSPTVTAEASPIAPARSPSEDQAPSATCLHLPATQCGESSR